MKCVQLSCVDQITDWLDFFCGIKTFFQRKQRKTWFTKSILLEAAEIWLYPDFLGIILTDDLRHVLLYVKNTRAHPVSSIYTKNQLTCLRLVCFDQ